MGHLKKVGARIQYVVEALALGQQRIAFLHYVIDIEGAWRPPARQPASECGLMRQDVTHEPARSVDIIQGDVEVIPYFRTIGHRLPNTRHQAKISADVTGCI